MKKQKTVEDRVLIVALDNDFRDGMRAMLESQGFQVLSRQSVERTILLLEVTEVSLIVTDFELEDGNYYDLLQAVRKEENFYADVSIYCIGDQQNPDECVKTLSEGASDYSSKPINRKIFLARVGKLIENLIKYKNNPVSLELRVDSGEIPGFFQFMEAENKTGVLHANYKKDKAEIVFKSGKVVKAETEYCEAQDALTEVLTWPFCLMRFIEEDVEGPFDINLNISSTLMDCVFGVDEYKEVLESYPDFEVSFKQGSKPLPKNSNRVAKKVHRMAASGTFLDELLDAIKINRRHLILLIDQLVKMGHLEKSDHPFSNYYEAQKEQYKRVSLFRKSIPGVVKALEDIHFQKFDELSTMAIDPSVGQSVNSPKIFIIGDHPELNEILFKTYLGIAANSAGKKSPVKTVRSNEAAAELQFSTGQTLTLHKLPQRIDDHFLKEINEEFSEAISIFYIVSGLDRETSRRNKKCLKKLRDYYKGSYYVIIPNLNAENPTMNIDCKHCSHVLAIDIDSEGSIGNCPICNTEITIPECLEYSADCLKLSPEVPRVFLNPVDPEECRDFLTLTCNTLLYSLPKPD